MAEYSVDVEPFMVGHITGRLGTAIVVYRRKTYRVGLGHKECTRDEHPVALDTLPSAVWNFAKEQYDALVKTYMERRSNA